MTYEGGMFGGFATRETMELWELICHEPDLHEAVASGATPWAVHELRTVVLTHFGVDVEESDEIPEWVAVVDWRGLTDAVNEAVAEVRG